MTQMQNRQLSLILFLFTISFLFTNCKNVNEEKKDVIKTSQTQEIESIKLSSISFYKWYLGVLNNDKIQISYDGNVIEGENGKCLLDLKPYFKELRNLKTISEKFIAKESERLNDCSEYLSTIDYSEYISPEFQENPDESYDNYCQDFNFYYWIRSQELYQNCSAKNIQITSKKTATADIFFSYKNSEDESNPLSRVYLEKENNVWKIIDIKFLQGNFKKEKVKIQNSWSNDMVSININSNKIVILFHGQCAGFYPLKKINENEVELIWANEFDCVFDAGTNNDYGLSIKPIIGKPFAKYILKGKVLYAKYYYPDWIKKYSENSNSEVFTSKYFLKTVE